MHMEVQISLSLDVENGIYRGYLNRKSEKEVPARMSRDFFCIANNGAPPRTPFRGRDAHRIPVFWKGGFFKDGIRFNNPPPEAFPFVFPGRRSGTEAREARPKDRRTG